MIYTFYYTDWRWLFQFCGKKIWFIPMCLPEPKIFLKFPQWWLGDPHFPFYWNIWQSTEWKIPALQLHIMDGPLHQVCIKVTKASYRDQVISLEQGQEKVPAYIPHIHLRLVNVTTFFFSVFTVTPKMLKVLYYLYLLSYSSHSVSGDNLSIITK